MSKKFMISWQEVTTKWALVTANSAAEALDDTASTSSNNEHPGRAHAIHGSVKVQELPGLGSKD